MDVDFKLNVIGIGIKRILWARLSRLLQSLLNSDGIELVFGEYNRRGLDGYKNFLEKRGQGEPDIIITTLDYFQDLAPLEKLISENSTLDKGGPPRVIFLEKDLNRFLASIVKNQPAVRFHFKRFGELEIHDANVFSRSEDEQIFLEIDPLPDLRLSIAADAPLNGNQSVSLYPIQTIEEVTWQQRSFAIDAFIKEQLDHFSVTLNRKNARIILKTGAKAYISSGLQLSELNAVTFNYLHIDHLISYHQIKKRSPNFVVFLTKFREIVKSRCCRILNEQIRENTAAIKSLTPVTVCSDFPVINDIVFQILTRDGYQQVVTTEQTVNQADRLLLSLTDSCEETAAGPLSQNLKLDAKIFDIPGFPRVTLKLSSQLTRVIEDIAIEEIQVERAQLIKKLKKLADQVKNLSGSKILADQEKYMNMLASRKLEIVTVLLEMATIWDEKDDKPKRTYEENVLVFHDDQLQGATINNQLEGDGKRLFVDVNRKFANLKSFITLNTDILEPFLHEGFIFCYAASKSISVRKLQQFQNDLMDKKYPEIAKGIENLKAERLKLQKRIVELAYIEAWQMMLESYQVQANLVFSSARNAYQLLQERRFSQDTIRSFCIFAPDEKRCQQIYQVIIQSFASLKKSRLDQVLIPLHLSTQVSDREIAGFEELSSNEATKEALIQEALIQNNVNQLTGFFQRAIKQLNLFSSDLLILVHELELITLLVRMLRQSNESYTQTPILAVFSGKLNKDKMTELLNQGVSLVYHDPLFSQREDDLTEQLRTVLH